MKKLRISLFIVVFLSASAIFFACKKDDTTIPVDIPPAAGSTSGSLTVQGAGYSNVTGSDSGTGPIYINARNMTPANSYPSVAILLSTVPTKDSTFTLSAKNNVKIYMSGQLSDVYTKLSGGNFTVTKSTSSYTVIFNSLTLTNATNKAVPTISASGAITVYQ
jgi:hypothetical protein